MPTPAEIEAKFWRSLESDMTVMLGLTGREQGHAQPMTAQLDPDRGDGRSPIWFFTAKDVDLVQAMGAGARASIQYSAKGHDLFASVQGNLVPNNDPVVIDRLWNKYVAAWYEGGKDDPKLQLLRFDGDEAQFWLNENSLFAGIKTMLGADPKQDYKDKVAEVSLG